MRKKRLASGTIVWLCDCHSDGQQTSYIIFGHSVSGICAHGNFSGWLWYGLDLPQPRNATSNGSTFFMKKKPSDYQWTRVDEYHLQWSQTEHTKRKKRKQSKERKIIWRKKKVPVMERRRKIINTEIGSITMNVGMWKSECLMNWKKITDSIYI